MIRKQQTNVLDLFENKDIVKICAPMVRYSKLQFRNLVTSYNCDLTYTPMILADSFCKSEKARNNEFTTNSMDSPLITQFASNTVHDFIGAAHLVSPYCDGVDLNCGCPQRWARQQGLGCVMLDDPQNIFEIVRQCKNHIPKPFTVSVKMRILKDVKKSINILKQLESAGVSYCTIHGRPPDQLTGDINMDTLKIICQHAKVPIVANGGVKSLQDCYELQKSTGCKGVMVANGILTNPTLFNGNNKTTMDCVQNWLDICYNSTLTEEHYKQIYKTNNEEPLIHEKPNNLTFQCFHHHLVFMLEKVLSRHKKNVFNNLQKFDDVLKFLFNEFEIKPQLYDCDKYYESMPQELDYSERNDLYYKLCPVNVKSKSKNDILYDYEKSEGKYFQDKTKNSIESDFDWTNMFNEI